LIQFAGVNQTHERCPPPRLRAPSDRTTHSCCNTAFFSTLSQTLLSSGAPGARRNSVSAFQCRSKWVIALPNPEFGSVLCCANCSCPHLRNCSINGLLCS